MTELVLVTLRDGVEEVLYSTYLPLGNNLWSFSFSFSKSPVQDFFLLTNDLSISPALGETTTAIAFDHTFTYAYIHIFQLRIQSE